MFKRIYKHKQEKRDNIFFYLFIFKRILDLIKTRISDPTLLAETEILLRDNIDTQEEKQITTTINMELIPSELMGVLDFDGAISKDQLIDYVGEAHLLSQKLLSKKQDDIMSKYNQYFSKIIHLFEMNPDSRLVNIPDMGTLVTQATTTTSPITPQNSSKIATTCPFSAPHGLTTASSEAHRLMIDVIKPWHVDVMDRKELPSGLIISTQSPTEDSNTPFPRRGGTAFAIQKITSYPCIKMHRDAKARPLEASLFSKLKHNSIIFITGHGDSGSDFLGGEYTISGSEDHEKNKYLQWSIEEYAKLIVENSSFKENDLVTIVLWACSAGNLGVDSTAVQLGRILRDEGVHVRIIASVSPLSRFDGTYEDDEAETSRLRFRTNQQSIRFFDCTDAGIIEYKNKNRLYFTDQGIVGYSPIEPLFIDGASLKNQVRGSDLFIKNGNRDAAITSLIKNKQNRCYVLTDSNIKVKGYHAFTMSLKITEAVAHLEFLIKGDKLWCYYENQKTQIQLLPDGIFFTLEQQILQQQEQRKIVFIPIAEQADSLTSVSADPDLPLNNSEIKMPSVTPPFFSFQSTPSRHNEKLTITGCDDPLKTGTGFIV